MKKILAFALALMLLCLPLAVAEEAANNAAVLGLSNINVMGNSLGDLEVWAGIEGKDVPQCLISAMVGEDTLVSAVGELENGQFRFMFDGEEKGYVQDLAQIPQVQQLGDQAIETINRMPEVLKQMIPALDSLVLPQIPGMPIPKIDVSALFAGLSKDDQNFTLSTEMIDTLLDMVQQSAGAFTSQVPQLQQVLDLLPQLKGQLALEGTFADEGDASVINANILVSGSAVATLVVTSKENDAHLSLQTDGTEQAALSLVSDPDNARMDVTLGAMGMNLMALSIFQEDGLQKISFAVSAGTSAGVDFAYGSQNGADVVSFGLNAADSGELSFVVNTAKQEDGTRAGTVTFDGTFNGSQASFSADVSMYLLESLELGEIEWPAELLPFSQMDAQTALQPVVEYVQGIAQDAAA